jgi:nitrite reductase (NO-forming)
MKHTIMFKNLIGLTLISLVIAAPKINPPTIKVGDKKKMTFDEKMAEGKKIYTTTCIACHQANGQGLPNAFPPLAKSDFLMKNNERAIKIVTKGISGEITVNGKKYNGVMPPVPNISDSQLASILTYVKNSWGNKADEVMEEEVTKVRKTIK